MLPISLTLYAALFVIPALLVAAYCTVLVAARLLGARAFVAPGTKAKHSFVIVIPAHNEHVMIDGTLGSCDRIDYPREKHRVVVVADNCTDATAEVARARGATCLERIDPEHVGKGYALQWAFDQVLPQEPDAIVVLDADCRIDPHALRVFDHCLEQGVGVLQATHVISNPDDNHYTYAARIGQFLEYDMGYAPMSRLGMGIPLAGTGMVFRRDVLQQQPWRAHSLVEDAEYSLSLARQGIRVRFVENVRVFHTSETRPDRLHVQRARWASGAARLRARNALGLIADGLRQRQRLLIDAGWTLLVGSRPLILVHLLATLAIGLTLACLHGGSASRLLFGGALGALTLQCVYYTTGIALVGFNGHRLRLLLAGPLVVFRLVAIAIGSMFHHGDRKWARTPRG